MIKFLFQQSYVHLRTKAETMWNTDTQSNNKGHMQKQHSEISHDIRFETINTLNLFRIGSKICREKDSIYWRNLNIYNDMRVGKWLVNRLSPRGINKIFLFSYSSPALRMTNFKWLESAHKKHCSLSVEKICVLWQIENIATVFHSFHQEVESISPHLNLCWLCGLCWAMECEKKEIFKPWGHGCWGLATSASVLPCYPDMKKKQLSLIYWSMESHTVQNQEAPPQPCELLDMWVRTRGPSWM